MENKWKDILVAISIASVSSIFVFGMAKWPDYPKDGTILGNLYYVTLSSVLYMVGVIINIIAMTRWVKIASFGLMGIFGWNLYVEIFLDPTNWTKLDIGLLVVVPLNCLITGGIIEWLKTKKK